jgi:hypothetical protein
MPLRLNVADAGFEAGFGDLLASKRETDEDVGRVVAEILAAVKARGDARPSTNARGRGIWITGTSRVSVWVSAGPRSLPPVSMCPAARRPIPPRS